ncbi:MAG: hypothetical protein K2X77_30895 [Candidatus Obscuribacterales bacterium]|jgi:hypothetical protein|nr:hypothetical protein [Candidatus Obscuribacterales bacterium]
MQRNLSIYCAGIAVFCLYLLASGPAAYAAKKPEKPPVASRQFSREEFMILNLNRGNDSTGTHISDSLRQVRQMVRDLDKSLRQLQQAEREFAKSKGRPDDHFLAPAAAKLEQSLKTAQQLEQELEQSRTELKDSIHQALIMAQ